MHDAPGVQPVVLSPPQNASSTVTVMTDRDRDHRVRVGALLRARRTELGLNQLSAAHMIGASLTTYSRWERGRNAPNEASAAAIGRAFDLPVEELLPPDGQAAQPVTDQRLIDALDEIRRGQDALSAALEVLLSATGDDETRRTVAEQLREERAARGVAGAFRPCRKDA